VFSELGLDIQQLRSVGKDGQMVDWKVLYERFESEFGELQAQRSAADFVQDADGPGDDRAPAAAAESKYEDNGDEEYGDDAPMVSAHRDELPQQDVLPMGQDSVVSVPPAENDEYTSEDDDKQPVLRPASAGRLRPESATRLRPESAARLRPAVAAPPDTVPEPLAPRHDKKDSKMSMNTGYSDEYEDDAVSDGDGKVIEEGDEENEVSYEADAYSEPAESPTKVAQNNFNESVAEEDDEGGEEYADDDYAEEDYGEDGFDE
jgi:hypothetical protein